MRAVTALESTCAMRAKKELEPILIVRAIQDLESIVAVRAIPPLKMTVRASISLKPKFNMRAIISLEPMGYLRARGNLEPTAVVRATIRLDLKQIMRLFQAVGDGMEEKRTREWEKHQRELFERLKHPRLRVLVEGYYDTQKLRLSTENRLRVYSRFDLITPPQAAALQAIASDLRREEKRYEGMVADELKGMPIYEVWLKNVKGIGPMMAAGLVAWIDDPGRFDTVSKLWAYAVGKPGERRIRGTRVGYNPRLKVHCFKVGTQLLKARGEYADLYYRFKETYSLREDLKRIKKGSFKLHVHLMAMRKMVKVFLQHLWVRWREVEGLPITKPYVVEKLGHKGYISPLEVERKAGPELVEARSE